MIIGLTRQEFWGSIILLCVVGLIYFGAGVLSAERAAESVKPFKWGDDQRRSQKEPIWASHPILAAFTCLSVLFVLQLVL